MTLQELVEQYERIQQAKQNLITNGSSYSIYGSHSVTSGGTIADLTKEESRLRGLILRRMGRRNRYTYGSMRQCPR